MSDTHSCRHQVDVNGIVYGDEIMYDQEDCGQPASWMVDPKLRNQLPARAHYVCQYHAGWYGADLILASR